MTGPARIAVFALVLAGVFAGAAAVGWAVGPLERGSEPAGAHAEDEGMAAEARELSVEVVQGPMLRFRILAPGGRPVREYDSLHEREMHLIVVRRDFGVFRHLHPERSFGATWFVPFATEGAGSYTVFADFSTGGERHTLEFDVNASGVHGDFAMQPRPPTERTVSAGPYEVTLRGDLRAGRLAFAVRRDGRPVRVEPYLGARGHLVALRERDLRYLHVHAEEDELAFEAEFPSGGWYRLYLQFRAGGAVHTAPFVVRVPQ